VSVPDIVREVAQAVLYEGYLLWPYRRSALKNQHRWTIGGVYPRASGGAPEAGPCSSQTQCLVSAGADDTVEVRVRFLQVVSREVTRLRGGRLESVPELTVGTQRYLSWEEATEREVAVGGLALAELCAAARVVPIEVDAGRSVEWLGDGAHLGGGHGPAAADRPAGDHGAGERPAGDHGAGERPAGGQGDGGRAGADGLPGGSAGQAEGAMVRRWQALRGRVEIGAEAVAPGTYRLTVRVVNTAQWRGRDRRAALRHTFASAHVVIHSERGRLVSQTDPPPELAGFAAGCENIGTWPVLVGEAGDPHTMLSAPIILPDYPRIAPESPGDLFDATEIDALLTLNILTLGDDERREMRDSDPRAREILDRCAALSPAQLMRLHGRLRELHPADAPAPWDPTAPGPWDPLGPDSRAPMAPASFDPAAPGERDPMAPASLAPAAPGERP
jgi:hypothetical protein